MRVAAAVASPDGIVAVAPFACAFAAVLALVLVLVAVSELAMAFVVDAAAGSAEWMRMRFLEAAHLPDKI